MIPFTFASEKEMKFLSTENPQTTISLFYCFCFLQTIIIVITSYYYIQLPAVMFVTASHFLDYRKFFVIIYLTYETNITYLSFLRPEHPM
jgi:hypothetical protein